VILRDQSIHPYLSVSQNVVELRVTDILYASRPALCTWNKIFNRSSGDTTVLDTAPANPPAMKEATTGCDTAIRTLSQR